MEDNKDDSLAEKIAKQRQAANEQNEVKTGRNKSALNSASQKTTIPKQPEFDQETWDKTQAEKQKAINERSHKQQSQKSQPQQSRHAPATERIPENTSKPKTITNEPPPSSGNFRGGASGRGGGFPMGKEPDEMLKEKNDSIDPKDILSKKAKKENLIIAMNSDKKPAIINASDYTPPKKFDEPKKEPIFKSAAHPKVISKSESKISKTSKSEKPSPPQITNKVKR